MKINQKSWHFKLINYLYIKDYIKERPTVLSSYVGTIVFTLIVLLFLVLLSAIVASIIGGTIIERFVALDTVNLSWMVILGYAVLILLIGAYKLMRKLQNTEVRYK